MATEPEKTPEAETPHASAQKGMVVLIDDDKFLLDMYAMKFVKENFTVETFLSADQALVALREGLAPDAILFDITMPSRDGFSFLQALGEEKLGAHALKVALTNQSSDAEIEKAKTLGADGYFVKATMIPSEVVGKVTELIGKHRTK